MSSNPIAQKQVERRVRHIDQKLKEQQEKDPDLEISFDRKKILKKSLKREIEKKEVAQRQPEGASRFGSQGGIFGVSDKDPLEEEKEMSGVSEDWEGGVESEKYFDVSVKILVVKFCEVLKILFEFV